MRFIENGKWGYANIDGNKIIAAKFDGAWPFHNGIASVCIKCKLKRDGEYHDFDGGTQFVIDTLGNTVNQKQENKINDAVPDAQTAIKLAVAAWEPIYGKKLISGEKPYIAILKDSIWHVSGTIAPNMLGGVAEAIILKKTGKVLKVIHGQ